jgi:hypothetical protein
MSEQTRVRAPTRVLPGWQRWTRLLAALVGRRRIGLIDETSFAELYSSLTQACHDAAEASVGQERAFYESLESLVSPWVTLSILTRTEPAVVRELLKRCRAAEDRMTGRRPHSLFTRAVLIGGLAAGILATLAVGLDWGLRSFSGDLWRAVLAAVDGWDRMPSLQRCLILGVGILFLAVPLLARSARR